MVNKSLESVRERINRYEKAKSSKENWRNELQDAYDYASPIRANWDNSTVGQRKTNYIFDTTALTSLNKFANNIQSIMMPPFQQFAKLTPGPEVLNKASKQDLEFITRELDIITERLFFYLERSNFALVVNEAIKDMGISTGIMLLNSPSNEDPLVFTAIPADKMVIAGGMHGDISDYWREIDVPARYIKQYWPAAKLDKILEQTIKNDPDSVFTFVEGTIQYRNNDPQYQFYHSVILKDTQTEIFGQFQNMNRWIGFRMDKASNEVLGRGPVLTLLPTIRLANKMKEFEIRSGKMAAFPIYMAPDTGVVNAYNLVLKPGAIVPYNSRNGQTPIVPLQSGGSPQYVQLSLSQLQAEIREGLFSDPLGPVDNQVQSKVEVSIRQNNWLKQNAVSVGRLTTELLSQVIEKSVQILGQRGLINIPKIDGKFISVEYQSPLVNLQDQTDFDNLMRYIQFWQQTAGPQSLPTALNVNELREWVADKLSVDKSLIPTDQQVAMTMQNAAQLGQQLQKSQQQSQQPQEVAAA